MLLKELFLLLVLTAWSCEAITCKAGYTKKGEQCYKYVDVKKNYKEAQDICKADGALPVMPKTKEEEANMLAVRDVVRENAEVWFGLTDIKQEGTWVWEDGTVLDSKTSYTNWAGTEPNNYGSGEDCAIPMGENKWFDAACENQNYVMCQQAMESEWWSVKVIQWIMSFLTLSF